MDGLGVLMGLLISVIGVLIFVYADSYLKGSSRRISFFVFLSLFTLSMLGLVFCDNLIGLFVFWELTSLSSYLLIGFKHESSESRASALQALLVTGVGGLAMLAGFVLLGVSMESFELADLASRSGELQDLSLYPWIAGLILLGAFTKSAQFPFHFWLPNAMAAPTPVSAFLHSATMVKAGIFLMARLTPILGGTAFWNGTLLSAGALTVVVGAFLALGQRDLKKILAYTTVAALGTLTMLLGLGTPKAMEAFLAFFVAHALYKASLFMLAGAIEHGSGTRDLSRLSALRHKMPVTATLMLGAALAFAGLPPSFSFIAKELGLEAALGVTDPTLSLIATLGLVVGAAVFVYLALLLAWGIFFAPPKPSTSLTLESAREAPWGMLLGPCVLVTAGVVFGVMPTRVLEPLLEAAAAAMHVSEPRYAFSLWHGFTPPLFYTLGAILGGLVLYRFRARIAAADFSQSQVAGWGPESVYRSIVANIPGVSKKLFNRFQNGSLRFYLSIVLLFTLVFVLSPLTRDRRILLPESLWSDVRPEELIVNMVLLAGALFTFLSRKTFVALAATGIIGLSLAAYYVFYGAPDLAITQLLVESLSLILVIFVLFHFSRVSIPLVGISKWSTYVLSIGMGALFAVAMLLTLGTRYFPSISRYYVENSVSLANGSNVVNVIIVDFRAWDTMGEITVLALASIGVFAMLRWKKGAADA